MSKRRSKSEGRIFQQSNGLWVTQITLPDGRHLKYSKIQKETKEWLLEQRKALKDSLFIEDVCATFGSLLDRCYNIHQIRKLFETLQGDRLYPLFVLAIYIGMRRGELLALKWENVDFANRVIHVTKNRSQVSGKGLVIGEPKSEKSKRCIAVPQFALDVLLDHRMSSESEYVFATSHGTPFSPTTTLDTYSHLLPNIQQEAAEKFNDLLKDTTA